mmetsp:Transcript_32160/g.81955  ORF Transcript_32160/g.81955 Transcript_32160/m.81955 type:complete len:232 (+) Transcript_32160:491-1186(+)
MVVPVAAAAASRMDADTETPTTPDVVVPVSNTDVGCAACSAITAAACCGVTVTRDSGSGRMTNTTMTDPAKICLTSTRHTGMSAACATSALKASMKETRAGEPSGIVSMAIAIVSCISAGGSNSLMRASMPEALVFCCPPDHVVPTPTTIVPALGMSWSAFKVQVAVWSERSVKGEQGFSPDVVLMAPITSVWLRPKCRPAMVMTASCPATTCFGNTLDRTGAGKLMALAT